MKVHMHLVSHSVILTISQPFVFAKGHNSMLLYLRPHQCHEQSNTCKCLLCEISGLQSKAFKEILYMILYNWEPLSPRHHPQHALGKLISAKIKCKKKKNLLLHNTVTCTFAADWLTIHHRFPNCDCKRRFLGKLRWTLLPCSVFFTTTSPS